MTAIEQRTLDPDDSWRPFMDDAALPVADSDRSAAAIERGTWRGRTVVRKVATDAHRSALRREHELLDRLRLAGLIDVLALEDDEDGADRTAIVMVDHGRQTLARPVTLSADEVVRALRRCVAALADLHAAGWSHGSVRPEHVVVGARGRARWCSLGGARPLDSHPDAAAEDVRRLVDLIDHVASTQPTTSSRGDQWAWRRCASRLRRLAADLRRSSTPVAAVDLAGYLARIDAPRGRRHHEGRVLPREPGTGRHPWPPRRRRSEPAGGWPRAGRPAGGPIGRVGVAVLVLLALGGLLVAQLRRDEGAASRVPPMSSAVAADECEPLSTGGGEVADVDGDGCPEPVAVEGNVVTVGDRRYLLGADGDTAALGDWDCDGLATVRLLRPATGELFEFPVWATRSSPSDGLRIATTPGGVGVRSETDARTTPDGGSCARLLVALQDGTAIDPFPDTP